MISIDNIEKLKETDLPVIIYGADLVGKAMYNACNSMGIKVECFCDDSVHKIKCSGTDIVYGMEVVRPSVIRERYADAHFLISSTYINDIVGHLKKLNFDKWYDCSILRDYDFWQDSYEEPNGRGIMAKPAFVEFTINACMISHEGYLNKDKLFIRCVDLVITEKCSLKCKDCSNLMQYYLKPKNYHLQSVLDSIDSLFSKVDEVYEMRVIGGEPMMNRDIHLIMDRLTSEEKIKRIVIYTNATIPLREHQIESFKSDKVMFLITDYHELSRNREQLINTCQENGIDYHAQPVGGWVDWAEIKKFNRTPKENQRVFDFCCAKNNVTLMAGDSKLYNCPFAANGYTLDAFPREIAEEGTGDIIDVSDENPDLKKKIQDFVYRKDFVSACEYCPGREYAKPNIVPAIQVRKPIAYKKYERTEKNT